MLVKALNKDMYGISEWSDLKFKVFDWYCEGEDPVLRLKKEIKDMIKTKEKEIKKLNKVLNKLEKV